MNERVPGMTPVDLGMGSLAQRNGVLRNTYALLALSLVPTVLGVWFGMALGVRQNLGIGLSLLVFFGGMMAFMWGIQKHRNSGLGVALLLGFTFFMGVMLSRLVGHVLGMSNGATLVGYAFGTTAAVFAGMAVLASVIKRDLSGMGKFLMVGSILLLVAMLANIFIGSTALYLTLGVVGAGLFSAYMLYDLKQIIDGGETNYVMATMHLYLDIFNVFQMVLALFGFAGSSDD